MTRRKQMGDLLVEAGLLKKINLEEALQKQKTSKKRLGEILQEMGVVCEKDIAFVLANQFNIRSAPRLTDHPLTRELQDFVDLPTAMTKLVYPLSRDGGRLSLAMANPLDLETIDALAFRTGLQVVPCVSTPTEILAAVRHHYLETAETVTPEQCRILIVEDKEIVRTAAAMALRNQGYHVTSASGGEEGLEAVLRGAPHLVIAEIVMPGMDGRALYRALQENSETRHIPVIAFSSRSSKEEEAALLNMGFVDFLSKPLNQDLLKARVARVLDLVYPEKGFAVNTLRRTKESSLHEALHTLLDMLQSSMSGNATENR